MKLLPVICMVLLGCGALPPPADAVGYINPELRPYVQRFADEGNILLSTGLYVGFGKVGDHPDPDRRILAVCYMNMERVVVDRNLWKEMDETHREVLIFHELGHCVLGRYHIDYVDGVCPASIMHPLLPVAARCYERNRPYYIQELFTED